jgi:pyruvate,water dikinase
MTDRQTILNGSGASRGTLHGYVVIAMSSDEAETKLRLSARPAILITTITDPDWLVAMTQADGIVTDQGGILSHPAIVARELGIPCVVGTRHATSMLADGEEIEIDGTAGTVSNRGMV